jgi:hypothetical protein
LCNKSTSLSQLGGNENENLIGKKGTVNWNPDEDWTLDCDFPGNEIAKAFTSLSNCPYKCMNTPGCSHYTWKTIKGGLCLLKKGSVSKVLMDCSISQS